MKTITPGTLPQPPERRWWEGLKAQCPTCGALVELEADDLTNDHLTEAAQAGGKQWVIFTCPTEGCTTSIDLERNRPPFGEVAHAAEAAARKVIGEELRPGGLLAS